MMSFTVVSVTSLTFQFIDPTLTIGKKNIVFIVLYIYIGELTAFFLGKHVFETHIAQQHQLQLYNVLS